MDVMLRECKKKQLIIAPGGAASKDQTLEPSFTSHHPSKMYFLFSISLVFFVSGVIDNINANSK